MALSPNGPDRELANTSTDGDCMACTDPEGFLALPKGVVWMLCGNHMGRMKFWLDQMGEHYYVVAE